MDHQKLVSPTRTSASKTSATSGKVATRDHETLKAEELTRVSHRHFRMFGPPKGTRAYPKWLQAR